MAVVRPIKHVSYKYCTVVHAVHYVLYRVLREILSIY